MGILIEKKSFRNVRHILESRMEAGRLLSGLLSNIERKNAIVLAIPSGGVPVGAEISKKLRIPMDLLIVRKVQIPWNTEAGFGAVCPDGTEVLNEGMLKSLGLEDEDMNAQIEKARSSIREREIIFRKGRPFPSVKGKTVVITDDGLASGYTMAAAVRFVRKEKAGRTIVAVPTALERTAHFILKEVDELYCLNVRRGEQFAVADAYQDWHDVSDKEVMKILDALRREGLYELSTE